jgi:stress response protein YsnF
VDVERRPRDEAVGERREPWLDGEVLVVPVYEEVLVTERRLVLREEIRLVRRRESRTEHHEVPLMRQRAVLERRGPDGQWRPEPGDGLAAEDENPSGRGPASPKEP